MKGALGLHGARRSSGVFRVNRGNRVFRVVRYKEKHADTLFIPLTALRSSPKEIQGST